MSARRWIGARDALRFAYHLDDLRQQRIGADSFRFHHEASGSVDGAADYLGVGGLLDRNGFAADHGLIDGAAAFDHDSVRRNLFAGADAKPVAYLNRAQVDIALGSVCGDTSRGLRSQSEQRSDRAAGLAAGPQFQHLTEEDEHGDDRRRLKVEAEVA